MEIITRTIESLSLDRSNARFFSKRSVERFFKRVDRSGNGCWTYREVSRGNRHGYGKFHSYGKTWQAHRWIMVAIGKLEPESDLCVLHKCDNRSCVNPNHLYLGDRYQNAQDIKTRNRTHLIRDPKLGQKNPSAKLTDDQVRTIKRRLMNRHPGKDLALEYGVSKTTISEIKHGKVWGHIC